MENAVNLNRKLACLSALIVSVVSLAPMAAAQYYDPYYNGREDSRYDDRTYDSRNDDRYGRVRCESQDRHTRYCNVDTRGGVRLERQLSDRACVRGRTWGANERGIWVTDGCRAEFSLNGYAGGGYARSFRCESTDNRTRYCNVDTRYGVELVRQLSRNSCIEGRSWGVSRDGVWVSRGCRAEFAVSDRYYRDDASYRRY
jgi:hypothetical protein